MLAKNLYSQTPITSVSTTSTTATNSSYIAVAPSDASNDVDAGSSYTMSYGNGNNIFINSYTVGSATYNNFIAPDTLILQRTDAGELINVWYDLNSSIGTSTIELTSQQITDIDAMYLAGLLNAGYDNLLTNNDDLNENGDFSDQVERIDVIYRTGLVTSSPGTAMFPVVERGGNDAIQIAAITSLNSNGEPASFGSLVAINDAGYDPDGITDWGDLGVSVTGMIMRRQDSNTDPIPTFNISSQNTYGVAVSFSDLGIAANTTIYGYSLFAYDVDASTHTLTDITSFPTNSQTTIGGLDLIAGISAAVSSDNNLTKAVGPGGYIESLVTWLKANESDEVTTSTEGSGVTNWEDHWIGGHDATTSFTAPVYRSASSSLAMNFNPSIDFSASGTSGLGIEDNTDFNSNSGNYLNKSLSVAFRTGTIGTRQIIYEQGGSGNGINVYIDTDGTLYVGAWANSWTVRPVVHSTSVSANTEYIVTMELEGDNSGSENGVISAYLNGTSFGGSVSGAGILNSHGGNVNIGASDANLRYHDGSSNDDNHFEGEISEFIYCNEPASFSSTNRLKTESYLALKYGITLDQSSPINYLDAAGNIIFNTTNNASIGGYLEYNNDIAGIGRDDISELDQRKSKSENAGSILTIEKNSQFAEDDSWLIWGHDGSATTTTTSSDVPATVSQRLSREWRLAETNINSATVDVSFDLTGLGLSSDATEFSLLIAGATSGGDFSAANIVTGGTLNDNVITFTDVNLSDKEYLALGTGFDLCSPGGVSTNLKVWLRADKEVYNTGTTLATDGQTVNSWGDQSTSAADASDPDNLTTYETNEVNFNPAIEFNGDATSLEGSFTTTTAGLTSFTAGYFNSSSADFAAFFELYNTASGSGSDRARAWFEGSRYAGENTYSSGLIASNSWNFWSLDHPSGSTANIYENGGVFQLNYSTDWSMAQSGNYIYYLGDDQTGGNELTGLIGDLIVYEGTMTASERQQIETYLAIKYGVTMDQSDAKDYLWSDGSTVIWDASANSAYNNDIAGIGRDDASCLSQKQSKSVNSSAIVTIGLGSIQSDNESNSNSFGSDGDYLIWGHNGTSASTTQSSDLPGTVTTRLSRIWHVEETGTVPNTSVAFNLTGLGLSSTASDFQLIISSSATMASGSTIGNGSLDGNILTFNNVNFSDEDYFTLGTARSTCGPGGITTNMALWLQGDQGTNTTTDDGNITSWSDQSGNSNNGSQANLGGSILQQPTYQGSVFNFNPVIRFSDPQSTNGTYITTSSNGVTGDMTLISVFASGQNDGSGTGFEDSPALIGAGSSSSTLDYGLGISEGQLHFNASTGSSLDARSTASYSDNMPRIATGTRVQGTSGAIELYVNSANVGSGTSDANSLNAASGFGIGNHSSGNTASQFQGDIAETLVFSSILTSDQQNKVESYLALKYGITRNATDDTSTGSIDERDYRSSQSTVFWDYSLQSGLYNNNIAGIGKDDNSCLLQNKSKSVNTNAIVTMEVSSSISDDDSFLVWGNDNGAIEAANNSERPADISSRLNREWMVQETGNIETVNITFDLSSVTGPSGIATNNLTQLLLMISADNNFSSGVTTYTPSSFNDTDETVTFSVDLADETFFTLGSTEVTALPIELIYFDAEVADHQVNIKWTTASETDNAFFTIERSQKGRHFEPIASQNGAGHSQNLRSYTYSDLSPIQGTSYYRLKQTDFNGRSKYSEVIRVDVDSKKGGTTLSVYPNPVQAGEDLHISYSIEHDQVMQFNVISPNGHILHSEKRLVVASEEEIVLPTQGFKSGLHILRVVDENQNLISLKVLVP